MVGASLVGEFYNNIVVAFGANLSSRHLQLLPGRGETVGAALVSDPRVRAVMFTGSTEVGRVLLGGAALGIGLSRRWLKSPARRLLAIGAVLLVTALIWVEAAVGIFH